MTSSQDHAKYVQLLVQTVRDAKLAAVGNQVLPNAVLTPIRSIPPVANEVGVLSLIGGVFSADGCFNLPSALMRTHGYCQVASAADVVAAGERIDTPCIYGGILYLHYGHFILESLARSMYFALFPGHDILFHVPTPGISRVDQLPAYALEIFELLAVDRARLRLVTRATRVAELLVPVPGLRHWDYIDPLHLRHLERASGPRAPGAGPEPARKIYLSRSKLGLDTIGPAIVGEEVFERYLEGEGFAIVHPENLAPGAQIRLLNESRLVLGFIGSAFHTALFCRGGLSIVYLLQRPRMLESHLQYNTIDRMKKNRSSYLQAFVSGDEETATVDYQKISIQLLTMGAVGRTFAQAGDDVQQRYRRYAEGARAPAGRAGLTKRDYLALRREVSGY
jgi:capsular polysaccharide biosynthesis protein